VAGVLVVVGSCTAKIFVAGAGDNRSNRGISTSETCIIYTNSISKSEMDAFQESQHGVLYQGVGLEFLSQTWTLRAPYLLQRKDSATQRMIVSIILQIDYSGRTINGFRNLESQKFDNSAYLLTNMSEICERGGSGCVGS
jgi:hypothetical protein